MGNCKVCNWFEPEQEGRGHCFVDPPRVVVMPQQIPAPVVKSRLVPNAEQPQMGIFPVTVRPYVLDTHRCSRWKGKENG